MSFQAANLYSYAVTLQSSILHKLKKGKSPYDTPVQTLPVPVEFAKKKKKKSNALKN